MLSASKFISCKYHYCVLCPFFPHSLLLPVAHASPSPFPLLLLHTSTQVLPITPHPLWGQLHANELERLPPAHNKPTQKAKYKGQVGTGGFRFSVPNQDRPSKASTTKGWSMLSALRGQQVRSILQKAFMTFGISPFKSTHCSKETQFHSANSSLFLHISTVKPRTF